MTKTGLALLIQEAFLDLQDCCVACHGKQLGEGGGEGILHECAIFRHCQAGFLWILHERYDPIHSTVL